jgi:hypothetical protein
MNWRDPRVAKKYGIGLFLSGLFFFSVSMVLYFIEVELSPLMMLTAAFMILVSAYWLIRWGKCRHCRKLLISARIDNGICPYCGESLDPDAES